MSIPHIVIAGTHSGVGKTTVATAIMASLARRGHIVQPFKVGPDFIDPTFHRAATGKCSHNLDGWMLSRAANLDVFSSACAGCDIAVIEGVMGLFDGHDGVSESGSTAEIAKWLDAPVILVVDASAMARSAAALVQGFERFDAALRIAGVVFNRVAGERHFEFLRDAVLASCTARPLGFLRANDAIGIPERHLGLMLAGEVLTPERLDQMVAWIEGTLDMDQLLALASGASSVRIELPALTPAKCAAPPYRTRIGIARDEAFCFYYEHNLEQLRRCGAELIEFSPIWDGALPCDLDALYLGGGYPELHAASLSANEAMRTAVRDFASSGAPVYAECGGLMYLTEGIVDLEGKSHAMAGVFPTRARMGRRLAALGYVEVEPIDKSTAGNTWLQLDESARGHEFRYSSIDEMPDQVLRLYRVRAGSKTRLDGYSIASTLGSYIHLHFGSCPGFAARFVAAAIDHRQRRTNRI